MRAIILSALIVLTLTLKAQNNIYNTGTINLVPVNDYGTGNNWNEIFSSYKQNKKDKYIGDRTSLVMLNNGYAVVNHTRKNYYSLFDENGKFKGRFRIKVDGKTIKRAIKIICATDNNRLVTTPDITGNVYITDLNGNCVEHLKIDYLGLQVTPVAGNKIAILGHVPWKGNMNKTIIDVIDYKTKKHKIIWDEFRKFPVGNGEKRKFYYSYKFDDGKSMTISTIPYRYYLPKQILSIDGNIIIANPKKGLISVYNEYGKKLSESDLQKIKNYISVEEMKTIQRRAIEKFRNHNFKGYPMEKKLAADSKASAYLINKMEEDLKSITSPVKLSYYITVIKDSENNLLLFEIPREKNSNKFNVWVYKNGEILPQKNTLISDSYKLKIMGSKIAFHNGFIYSLQEKKGTNDDILHLVKFRLEPKQ
ncbi:MAG: hypothetical protein N4A72_06575 [Bacteroidales bacterium]|jgi:hypothetical protein|nr:hypothetical protein [Bacteroidales bacterium]